MLTLLGSLLGFGTSFLPKIMDYFQDRQDKAHELDMVAAQTNAQIKLQAAKLQEVRVQAESAEVVAAHEEQAASVRVAHKWIATLSASVRPVLTYWFFSIFATLKLVSIAVIVVESYVIYTVTIKTGDVLAAAIDGGQHFMAAQSVIWNEPTAALFAAVISFWFSSRTLNRRNMT